MKPSEKGPSFRGKNLLPEEQILFSKSWPPLRRAAEMKMAEVVPLNAVYPYTLNYQLFLVSSLEHFQSQHLNHLLIKKRKRTIKFLQIHLLGHLN